MTDNYSRIRAYGQSKLFNIYFTKELARRLKGKQTEWINRIFGSFVYVLCLFSDSQVTAYAVHPGSVDTGISVHVKEMLPGFLLPVLELFRFFLKTPENGAQTTLYCALEDALANQSGLYYA